MKKRDDAIILFKTEDEKISVDVRFDEDTVWLTLDQMAELFERDKSTISRHIINVFDDGELSRKATVANFATVQNEGGRKQRRSELDRESVVANFATTAARRGIIGQNIESGE